MVAGAPQESANYRMSEDVQQVELEYEHVAIDALTPHPENPRKGDTDLIAESIRANGFYGAVLVQRSTGYIIAGNHRWKAAKQVGMTEIPVMWLDIDDQAARRILLSDNRTSDLAGYDDPALVEMLAGLPTLTGTGYTKQDVDDLEARIAGLPAPIEPPRPAAEQALNTEDSGRTPPLGLREVRLVFTTEEYDRFVGLVSTMEAANTSQAVLKAVRKLSA